MLKSLLVLSLLVSMFSVAQASTCSDEATKAAILALLPQDASVQAFIAPMSFSSDAVLTAPYMDNEFTHYLVIRTSTGAEPTLLQAKVNGKCQAFLVPGEADTTQIK